MGDMRGLGLFLRVLFLRVLFLRLVDFLIGHLSRYLWLFKIEILAQLFIITILRIKALFHRSKSRSTLIF